MIETIIIILSIYLDGLLNLILPYTPNELSLFTPMLTIVSIFIIYPFYRKNEKKYFITIGIVGLIYDLLYTNLLFYNSIVFILLGYITKYIYKNLDVCHLKISFYIIFILIIYELIMALFIILFNLVPITIGKVLYKISHEIILNIIYGELLLLIINIIPKKYKKININ